MKADSEVQSVAQYEKCLERYRVVYADGLYLRGEADDYPDNKPSLARNSDLLQNEGTIFKRYISEHPEDQSDSIIKTLAKIQHYGSMTRLVDLTVDPLVALYFACESNDDKPGFVFLYIPNGTEMDIDSPEVRALSIYSSEDVTCVDELGRRYEETYGENADVVELCSKSFIMKYDERLLEGNERMKLQKGAFALCGADILRLPQRTVIPFELKPTRTFLIPAGFKETIRKQLQSMGVQPNTIYPEPASSLARIKKDLCTPSEAIDLACCYEVIENSGVRNKGLFRDLVLKIKLNRPLDNDSVKEIVRIETKKCADKADVIWSYVANNDLDVQIANWRIRGKWIRPGIDMHLSLREKDSDGFSWDITPGSTIQSQWIQENGFGDDKAELCKYIKAFRMIMPEIEDAQAYAAGELAKPTLLNAVRGINVDVLYARAPELEQLFQLYSSFFSSASTVSMLVGKDEKRVLAWELRENTISDAQKIEKEVQQWITDLEITEEDIDAADPFERKSFDTFVPTIPMSKNPLQVEIAVIARANRDGRVEVTGTTNLFDGAELMIQLDRKAADKIIVRGGSFTCILGASGNYHSGAHHVISVSLSMPAVQSLEFLKSAGMEYENLSGNFIKRGGFGVTGAMDFDAVLQ